MLSIDQPNSSHDLLGCSMKFCFFHETSLKNDLSVKSWIFPKFQLILSQFQTLSHISMHILSFTECESVNT